MPSWWTRTTSDPRRPEADGVAVYDKRHHAIADQRRDNAATTENTLNVPDRERLDRGEG